jgi:F-type H+-transporting ATPase subunit alpha
MKQVGGTLKLDLAQFREMAAFAQFGSDLDASSQRLLHRGERLTEMLKQGQYEPLPVEKEVLIIFAGNEGYFDKLAVDRVKPFEHDLYTFFDSKHSDLLDEIRAKREIDNDLRARLTAALDEFVRVFAPAMTEAQPSPNGHA